jgi:hypothetical protein
MGRTAKLGLSCTILASLGTIFFVWYAITEYSGGPIVFWVDGSLVNIRYEGMACFGVLALVFCYLSTFYIVKKKHFILALSGPIFILVSCFAEFWFVGYISYYWPVPPTMFEFFIFLQFLLSLAGVVLVFKARKNFTLEDI